VVLFELLTGRPAFAGDTVTQVCALVLEAKTPPLAEHCANAPPELARVIERCLMKDPKERFQSAAELANALLPFAPPRARLHAERATSVLRAADANGGDALPSTLPEGRGVRESHLATAAPTVLGADITTRRNPRAPWLLIALASVLCLGLGFLGFRGWRAAGADDVKPSVVPASSGVVPASTGEQPGRMDAPEAKARPPLVQSAEGAVPRVAPALTPVSHQAKAEPPRSRAKARGTPAPSAPAKVAASEPPPSPSVESKAGESDARSAKPRARLLNESSPVRLLE
jgi:serine/threonine-protein kinase